MTPEQQLRDNVVFLLSQIGERSTCKGTAGVPGCGATIWWVRHANGKRAPYTADAMNHWIDCVQAPVIRAAFKAKKQAESQKRFSEIENES